jgi:hypothetical protein
VRVLSGRVGCGESLLAPDWRHWVKETVVCGLPERVGWKSMGPEMRNRREEKREGERKGMRVWFTSYLAVFDRCSPCARVCSLLARSQR